MKSDKINQRVVTWPQNADDFRGRTGTIIKHDVAGQLFSVFVDGWDDEIFAESEVYFPDHPLGYNQPCFQ